MPRGTRSTATLVASLVVASVALTACGEDVPGSGLDFGERLDAVTIAGEVGAAKLEFKQRMDAGELEAETVETGDGAALKDEDKVYVNFVLGDGYTRKTAVDTFGEDPAIQVTVGAPENAAPQSLGDVVANLLRDHVKAGVTRKSRIVLTGDTKAMFGELAGSPVLATEGIGNDDGLVLVADLLDVTALPQPDGAPADKVPGWAPAIVSRGGNISDLDFTGIDKPTAEAPLSSFALNVGTGKEVAEGDLLTLDYVGTYYDAEKPFVETYSTEPLTQTADVQVPGFGEALQGKTVGSRVVVRVPPAKGYGPTPPGGLDVPADSTLYYVIDILAAV